MNLEILKQKLATVKNLSNESQAQWNALNEKCPQYIPTRLLCLRSTNRYLINKRKNQIQSSILNYHVNKLKRKMNDEMKLNESPPSKKIKRSSSVY